MKLQFDSQRTSNTTANSMAGRTRLQTSISSTDLERPQMLGGAGISSELQGASGAGAAAAGAGSAWPSLQGTGQQTGLLEKPVTCF